jgi:hypothetical protein
MADKTMVAEFDQEMFRIYERASSEANYNATRFLHMLYEHRGLETARILLHSTNVCGLAPPNKRHFCCHYG